MLVFKTGIFILVTSERITIKRLLRRTLVRFVILFNKETSHITPDIEDIEFYPCNFLLSEKTENKRPH